MELAGVKEMVGDRLCLTGNVDITHVLVDAGKEEVYEAVRCSIEDAGSGGEYTLSPTNSHTSIDAQCLAWMLEAVEKYGRYPLDKNAEL
ncbi:MAG: uroporphyrinogen decarboxylase family protein [Actinomycetota bacterium]|nr:uroporphyrinogen decarboxylase family protein [Actinomycetota bacterium]